jgi:hypothetical protein
MGMGREERSRMGGIIGGISTLFYVLYSRRNINALNSNCLPQRRAICVVCNTVRLSVPNHDNAKPLSFCPASLRASREDGMEGGRYMSSSQKSLPGRNERLDTYISSRT